MRRRYQTGGLAAGTDDEDQNDGAVMDPEADEDMPGEAVTSSGGLAALDIPGAQEAFTLMQKSAADARAALQEARNSIMARQYSKADALLAASAALGAPTRAGSTAESFGAMAGALRGPLAAKREFQTQQQKDLLGVNTQLAGLDEREAQARLALATVNAKLRAQAANAPLEKVIVPGQANPVAMTRPEAHGKQLWVPPPLPNFTVTQQPNPDGTITPVKVDHRTGDVTPVGKPYVPVPKLTGQSLMQAKGKLATVQILREQLADIREKWKPLKDSFSAGKYQGWWPSETGSNFDKAVAAARGTIRQLTRVPGEGSMSDWEGKLDQAKLPDRNDYESSTEQSMDQLEKLLNGYERTTSDMLGIKPIEDVANKPAAKNAASADEAPADDESENPDDNAPARAPAEAEAELRAKPTPEMKRFFIETFGYLPDDIPL